MGKKKEKSKSKHKLTQKYKYYRVEGEIIKRDKEFCPKCGPGVFLGRRELQDKVTYYCGSCFLSIEKKK
ncbi:MAG TPA: 30S ribosomal protein S27ae [Candidatus Aenigmarchaeota archaeon]|nr:30S ribosomal protein S27ae [Candidatus Aenigmarchaeota archaeon]